MLRYPAVLLALLFVSTVVRAELRLEGEINGHRVPISSSDRHHLYYLAEGKPKALPPKTPLFVEGDLRTNAAEVLWSPTYSITRPDVPDWLRDRVDLEYFGLVSLDHRPEWPNRRDLFLRHWPSGVPGPGVVVLAWMTDGKICKVAARPVPDLNERGSFSAVKNFSLTRTETKGQGVVLVWHQGHFAPPQPRFAEPNAERCLEAILFNDVEALRAGLAGGVKPDTKDREGVVLLQYAAEMGADACVEVLLAARAKVNVKGAGGTPLTRAVGKGRTDTVDRLLAARADPRAGSAGAPALSIAIQNGYEDIALRLLEAGADSTVVDPQQVPPLVLAVDAGMVKVAKALPKYRSMLAYQYQKGQLDRVLGTQAMMGHSAMVDFLLENGAHADAMSDGLIPLVLGADSGDPHIASSLIANGAKPDRTGKNGVTALMMTARRNFVAYAKVLLDAGAEPKFVGPHGYTALHFAAGTDAAAIVRLLLAHGADVNAKAGTRTPLDVALQAHAINAALVLSEGGARIDLKSAIADQQLDEALVNDIAPLIAQALADGWSANAKFGRWPALAVAKTYRAEHCMAVLQEAGAQLDPEAPECVAADKVDSSMQTTHRVTPSDPRAVNDEFPESTVVIEMVVDRDGAGRFPRVISGQPILVHSTLAALREWRFTPAMVDHEPVPVLATIPIQYPASQSMRFEGWELDTLPVPVSQPPPVYPIELRRRDFAGTVVLKFLVNSLGHTERIHAISSAHPEFTAAAIEAVRNWVFEPGLIEEKPVETWMMIPIAFNLR